jgi:hypothetical protein
MCMGIGTPASASMDSWMHKAAIYKFFGRDLSPEEEQAFVYDRMPAMKTVAWFTPRLIRTRERRHSYRTYRRSA